MYYFWVVWLFLQMSYVLKLESNYETNNLLQFFTIYINNIGKKNSLLQQTRMEIRLLDFHKIGWNSFISFPSRPSCTPRRRYAVGNIEWNHLIFKKSMDGGVKWLCRFRKNIVRNMFYNRHPLIPQMLHIFIIKKLYSEW